MARTPLPLFLLATACGPDLAEIETRQQSLRREVDVLSRDVAKMRRKMQEMDLLPSGPHRQAHGGPDKALDVRVEVEVEGTPPDLPALGALERRAQTACGYRMRAPSLVEISDRKLYESGSGFASPVTLAYEGRALEPHAGPAKVENGCNGAFRVQPRFVFLSPFAPDAIDGTFEVALQADQPVRRGNDGLGVYWVYPGTAVTFAFAEGWNDEHGAFAVQLDARVLRVGAAPTGRARVEALGEVEDATGDRLGAPDIATPEGPWTLRVSSPPDGPYVLIESLWVGNPAVGRVVVPVAEASR